MATDLKQVLERFTAPPPYIQHLRREAAERQARRDAEARQALVDPRQALRDAITAWWAALPTDQRQPRYRLEELVPLIRLPNGRHPTMQQLGGALFELSWRRKRSWRDSEPCCRWWYPPALPPH